MTDAAPGSDVLLTVVNGLFLTMADGQEPFVGWMTVGQDGRILGIGPGPLPEGGSSGADGSSAAGGASGTVLDAGGKIVAPGFLSAHSHLFTSGMRGLSAAQTLYGWVRTQGEFLVGADEEDLYWFTLHGSLDFVVNGITSAYNFSHNRVIWLYDAATARATVARVAGPEHVYRQFDATADAGLRAMHAVQLGEEAFGDDEVRGWFGEALDACADRIPAPLNLGFSVFGAVQWATDERTARLEAEMMHRHGVVNQAHFVETAQNMAQQQAKFDWYQRAGALGPTMLFGHFVHPTDEMVDAVAATGSGMVWQPTSNGRLGSGLADVPRYLAAGIGVGVGLDDQSCTDVSDPFQNLRIGAYSLRAQRSQASVMMPRDMLRLHTLGSAEVLGVADRVGSLEPGKFADFLVVDPAGPDTGPLWDPWAGYVFACSLRNLKQVWVGGRLAVQDGRSLNPLAEQARTHLHERARRAGVAIGLPAPLLPAPQ